jgi:hypothetical protein
MIKDFDSRIKECYLLSRQKENWKDDRTKGYNSNTQRKGAELVNISYDFAVYGAI